MFISRIGKKIGGFKKMIEVTHPNGLKGKLIGENEMTIMDSSNKELFHTSFRSSNIQTEEDLYEQLEHFDSYVQLNELNKLHNY